MKFDHRTAVQINEVDFAREPFTTAGRGVITAYIAQQELSRRNRLSIADHLSLYTYVTSHKSMATIRSPFYGYNMA